MLIAATVTIPAAAIDIPDPSSPLTGLAMTAVMLLGLLCTGLASVLYFKVVQGPGPQYDGLEKLYDQYDDQGLVVVGFPSNDFFGQEPGTEEEIQDFCRLTYGVKFPMFENTTVREGSAHPFFAALAASVGTYPTWNFHKFLIGRDGQLITDFSPRTKPYDKKVIAAIKEAPGDS